MCERIGIMGGTFSPIHFGHIKLAQAAYDEFSLDKVLFIPSGNSYLKNDVLDSRHRLEMTRLAVEGTEYFEVSTIEIDRGGNSYSFETLEELKVIYPTSDLFFIVGADSFLYMDKWKEPSRIFKNATILVAVRDDSTLEDLKVKRHEYFDRFKAKVEFLSIEHIDISSTDIRNSIISGEPIDGKVPERVLKYIENQKLYLKA